MRKVIAGMQTSVDERIEGPEGYADWVDAWSDAYDVMPRVDACLLGATMYPGYEQYWGDREHRPIHRPPIGRTLRHVPSGAGGRMHYRTFRWHGPVVGSLGTGRWRTAGHGCR